MGFLKIFSGKDPAEYEKEGDVLFEKGDYGAAKIEYETALSKLAKKAIDDSDFKDRVCGKIVKTKNALSHHHKQMGDKLFDDENYDDAEEKYQLAMELAEDEDLKAELEERINELETLRAENEYDFHDLDLREEDDDVEHEEEEEEDDDEDYQERLDEYFIALTGSLPEQMAVEYRGYGDDFKVGYVALNHGDFELALKKLSIAANENDSKDTFIPLELATAHLNLKQYEEARALFEDFLKKHPDFLPAYHFLCEIYWEQKEFDLAQEFLNSCPEELKQSLSVQLLLGQTLYHSDRYEEAEKFFHDYLKNRGWNDVIARELALTFEALGKKEDARDLIDEIINSCRECRCSVDPFLKQKYADLCLETGIFSDAILELYLCLVHENPHNKVDYYQKISHIYSHKGNKREAKRYQAFAKKLEEKEELKSSSEDKSLS